MYSNTRLAAFMRAGVENPGQPRIFSLFADRGSVVYQISESICRLRFVCFVVST